MIQRREKAGWLERLEPDDRDWLMEDRRRLELAVDPGKGGFSVLEARAAIRAEEEGIVEGPLRRALSPGGNEPGVDFYDATGKGWDHKSLEGDIDKAVARVMETAGNGENMLIDTARAQTADIQQFLAALLPDLHPGPEYIRAGEPPEVYRRGASRGRVSV